MHIAFVDANLVGLRAVRAAKAAGHRVTFVAPADPWYAPNEENLAILRSADRVISGIATTDADEVTETLAKIHAEDPIDIANSQLEYALEAVSIACQRLGLGGTSPRAVLTARRKDQCRAALAEASLASARFEPAADEESAVRAAGRIGYPVVIKPPSGADSLLAAVARDAGEARAACRRMLAGARGLPSLWQEQFSRGFLVEELLVGRLVSVEIGRRYEEFFPLCITGRLRWAEHEVVELGGDIPAQVSADEAIACTGYAVDVLRAIGLDLGVFHLEMIITEHGPVLVEANPRAMGGSLPTVYQHATGQDIYAALAQIFSGDRVEVPARLNGCTGVRRVMARADGRIPAGASLDWLASYPGVFEVAGFSDFHTSPGEEVHQGQVIARFVLGKPDPPSLASATSKIMTRLEHELEISLMTGALD